ncbi:hypothetical protein AaE_013863 [Aphanomyces astaci]|uniref:HTH CENPB-type domain-containing protein n=1 Tax=Aphanomyces astaci TaxID=112090 RepID=A0A6A4ZHD9_APHAT|nr:hypothetical protein AaE_013863 [Aphanomyces astaci]
MKLRMTMSEKHELNAHHMQNPSATYTELATWAALKFALRQATLSYRSDKTNRKNDRIVTLPDIEVRILEWVLRCEDLCVYITGELIRKHASVLCDQIDVSSARFIFFSKGWLYKFQLKYGLTRKVQHGEVGSVSPADVAVGRQAMMAVTRGYDDKNTYNLNETVFFYCMAPHHSITRNRQPRTKKSKKRIIALTTNADRSNVVDPVFIGTAPCSRCFNGMSDTDLGFDYLARKKGWMTGNNFNAYLNELNDRMSAEDRRVLLLVDNAPPHKPDDETLYANVNVKMLLKNTTSHLQQQDAGIIASFKAKVKQRQVQNALDQIGSVMAGRQDTLYEVPLVEAMAWAKEAWRSVAQSTIVNCWKCSGILDTDLSSFSEHVAAMEHE